MGLPIRPEISASWRRVRTGGLAPGAEPAVAPLTEVEVEERRARSALSPYLPHLRRHLEPLASSGHLIVVTDADGRVLWRTGAGGVRRLADRLGFIGGSAWTERNVGTNAIGTALVVGAPVQINGAEHYVESHTRWSCAAAPIHDPWTGQTLGVVDVSVAASTMHPSTVTLVSMSARLAELELRTEHAAHLETLRAYAAPLVSRLTGRALAVDQHGHVAAVTGFSAPERVALPDLMPVGEVVLPGLGQVYADPLPGGWLLRLAAGDVPEVTHVVVDFARGNPTIRIEASQQSWSHTLTARHAEILLALVSYPHGRTGSQLADDLFADTTRVVTVRAELSRLRRAVGPVLAAQPYRIADGVRVEVHLPPDTRDVLPRSSAPIAARVRSGDVGS